MSDIQDLCEPGVVATFDATQRIIFVRYSGKLAGENVRGYYRWLMQQMLPLIRTVRGSVFDFREVESIAASNTRTVPGASSSAHRNIDLSHIPVALIAKDHYQEHILRITSAMTPHPETKRVVKSMEEALGYISEWEQRLGQHET